MEYQDAPEASEDCLVREEAAYDRGYDEGFKARDDLANRSDLGPLMRADEGFTRAVKAVLREVGLLG